MLRPSANNMENFRNAVKNARSYLAKCENKLQSDPDNPALLARVQEAKSNLIAAEQRLSSAEEIAAQPEIIRRDGRGGNFFG